MCSEQLLGSRDSVSPMRWLLGCKDMEALRLKVTFQPRPVLIQLVLGVAADNSSCSGARSSQFVSSFFEREFAQFLPLQGLTLLQKVPSLQHQFVLATVSWLEPMSVISRRVLVSLATCHLLSAIPEAHAFCSISGIAWRGRARVGPCRWRCESRLPRGFCR